MITVFLDGHIRIVSDTGQSLTPKAMKTRGLLVLLALSPGYRRSRAWVMDKLWSDRGQEQAATSLRQALSDLRRALGEHRGVLICEGGSIQLAADGVCVAPTGGDGDTELCEDLDIRDPEFENWLRDKRLSVSRAPEMPMRRRAPSAPVLLIALDNDDAGHQWPAHVVRENVARSLQEFSDIRILDLGGPDAVIPQDADDGLYLRLRTSRIGHQVRVSATIETVSGRWTLWQSPSRLLPPDPAEEDIWQIRAFSQLLVARVLTLLECRADRLHSGAGDFALALATRASRLAFRFGRSDLTEADRLFRAAYEIDPRGSYLSWRGLIRNTARFEHLTEDFLESISSHELHAHALEDDPRNSIALVLAAQHSFVNEKDFRFGQMLCDRALEINPSNALGWAFKTNMYVLAGEERLAAEAGRRAAGLASGLPCFSLASIFACMGEAAVGNYHAALAHGRMGSLAAPKFQAIRRYLFSIYKALDIPDEAEAQLRAIREREPDFEPEKIISPDYPTETLRRLRISTAI